MYFSPKKSLPSMAWQYYIILFKVQDCQCQQKDAFEYFSYSFLKGYTSILFLKKAA